jgi:phosphoglycerol transferase
MLTVDTHFPDGYVCSLCDDEFEGNQYANVMHCSSRQVTEFIKWCQQQPWYSNTTIVISGDHPTMDADFCDDVAKDYQRKVYTVYINADAKPADPDKTRLYSTFDDFPTTLAALGCTIDGNRLGLGTNLFSDVPTLTERDGLDEENVELMRNSQFMNKASGISRQVIETRRAIRKMKPKIKASNEGEFKHFEITGLQDLTKFGMEIRYAYLQIRGSDQLILYSPKLERQPDGTYTANVRLQRFDGYDTITAMVRIKTQNGTVDLTDNVKFKTD